MGDPNASIPTPQPVKMRPMFGAQGPAVGDALSFRTTLLRIDEESLEDHG